MDWCLIKATAALIVGFVLWAFLLRPSKNRSGLRKGMMVANLFGTGALNKGTKFTCTVMMTELEKFENGYSRIRIDEISGAPDANYRSQVRNLIGTVILTDKVKWLPAETKVYK